MPGSRADGGAERATLCRAPRDFDPKDGDAQSHLKYKIEVDAKVDAKAK
jgi:hypothetical protein